MKKSLLCSLLLGALPFLSASAKVTLPSVLADNMVLQQQTDVTLWGHATAGKRVVVTPSWSKQKTTTTADKDGKWELKVKTPEAGGPYDITFSDGETTKLNSVLIGEVWFCSGQSNMEMPVRGFDRQPMKGCTDLIAKAKPKIPIRIFCTDSKDGQWVRQYSDTPQEDIKGEWMINNSEGVASCSAIAYYFATYLQDVLDVPVGVVVSTLGGSRIEPWMSYEALKAFPKVKLPKDLGRQLKEGDIRNIGTALYNAKVAPLTKFAVRGFLWYQGEANVNQYKDYEPLMEAMVKNWRAKWGRGDLPFYMVQIAPYNYSNDANKREGAFLREAQAKAAVSLPNAGIVPTVDVGWPVFIHPVDKKTVGDRLALMALGKTYGHKGFYCEAPSYKSMEIKDHKIYINMNNCGNGACPMWTSLKGFEIAGADHVFYPAFAEVETATCRLAVSSVKVPDPVAVRYCFHNFEEGNVYNIGGWPLMPFRTDNWDTLDFNQ